MNDEQVIRLQAAQLALQYPIVVKDAQGVPVIPTVETVLFNAQQLSTFITGQLPQ